MQIHQQKYLIVNKINMDKKIPNQLIRETEEIEIKIKILNLSKLFIFMY
jgi:hypothetical protein